MSTQSLTTRFLAEATTPTPDGGWMRTASLRRRQKPHRTGLWSMIAAAYRLRRSRITLAGLDTTMLKDIGVSSAEAEYEINKPFWRS